MICLAREEAKVPVAKVPVAKVSVAKAVVEDMHCDCDVHSLQDSPCLWA